MTRTRTVAFILALSLVATLALATETGRCIRVVDGDTIEVDIAGRTEKVRLIGVDTPETVHPNTELNHCLPSSIICDDSP